MDRDELPAPRQGLVLTHFLTVRNVVTVRNVAVSRRFYADIFGGQVVLEENPAIDRIANGRRPGSRAAWSPVPRWPPHGRARPRSRFPRALTERDTEAVREE